MIRFLVTLYALHADRVQTHDRSTGDKWDLSQG
jgi:hypothetical protein